MPSRLSLYAKGDGAARVVDASMSPRGLFSADCGAGDAVRLFDFVAISVLVDTAEENAGQDAGLYITEGKGRKRKETGYKKLGRFWLRRTMPVSIMTMTLGRRKSLSRRVG